MATELKSLDGLAVKGVKAHASPGERFVSATLATNRLVIVYSSSTTTMTSKRRQTTVTTMRLVTCERSYHDGDFVWLPTGQHVLTTERSGASRNRHDWFVPTGKALIK